MLKGLQMMEESARRAFLKELGLQPDTDDTYYQLVGWMSEAVGSDCATPEAVELDVLRWMAGQLDLKGFEKFPVDQLEATIRRHVADESQDFLYPFMEVGCAVAYIGPQKVVGPKLELLESSTAGLIPSHTARDRMRQAWLARGAKLLASGEKLRAHDVIEQLAEPISILKLASEPTRAAVLVLCHAVALSDGRFEVEEEQFAELLAAQLGVGSEKLQQISSEVGKAFWNHLSDLGGGTHKARSTGEELALNMRAAQLALESCGSLASFSQIVEKGFVGSLHSSMSTGEKVARKLKTWGNTPIRLSLGFATGMLCYIRDRWNADEHETLMRLTLASIYQQHLLATGDHAEISEDDVDDYVPEQTVENPAEVLAETVIGREKSKPVRKISLEPTKFERK